MEINERVNGKCECDTELETIDVAVAIRDPYWGNIEGDIHRQEDLQQEFSLYRKKDDQDAIDNEIKEGLANEITRATNVEGELDAKIDDETTRATTAEGELRTSLDTEIQRATDKENELETNLNSEIQRAKAKENEIVDNLNSEILRAKAAESTNAINIADEITRAKKAEEVLTTNLSTEVSDRKKADNNLQTQIDAINSRSDVVDVVATKAELDAYDKDITINDIVKVLQDETHDNATSCYRNTASSKPYVWEFIGSLGPYYIQAQTDGLINNEATLRESKDNELNTKIDGEIDRAKGVESTLTANLSNEVTRAKAKENELNTKFADYLLKSDAPGYADILTKTLASTTYETIENANSMYATKVSITDIVDNLTSTDTDKPLSANQGRVLKNLLDNGQLTVNSNTKMEFYKNVGDRKRLMLRPTGPKDITSYYNDGTLWQRITDGFDDIYVGDFFNMGTPVSAYEQTNTYQTTGSSWVTIADFNLFYDKGDKNLVNVNTICCIPGKGLEGSYYFGRSRMNETNTTEGGYVATEMDRITIGNIATSTTTPGSTDSINQQLFNIFGSHLVTTRESLCNACTNGSPSGWAWFDKQAMLLSEAEVYGTTVWSKSGYNIGVAWQQLALFQLYPRMVNNRSSYYWLKDIADASGFALVYGFGGAGTFGAGDADCYVRPRFILKP